MINRKKELIDKLDAMDERSGVGEVVSDLVIQTVIDGLDAIMEKRKDKIPVSFVKAFNALIDGLLDGEFERDDIQTKDGQNPDKPRGGEG